MFTPGFSFISFPNRSEKTLSIKLPSLLMRMLNNNRRTNVQLLPNNSCPYRFFFLVNNYSLYELRIKTCPVQFGKTQ